MKHLPVNEKPRIIDLCLKQTLTFLATLARWDVLDVAPAKPRQPSKSSICLDGNVTLVLDQYCPY